MTDPIDLLAEIVREHAPEEDMWRDSPFFGYRMVGNTTKGEIGEEFVRRFLTAAGFSVGNGSRTSKTDKTIEGRPFEIKTASLGVNGLFQFNHVRLDRQYEFLLCLGICPDDVVFNAWRKGDVAEGRAGNLVRMAEGQAVTTKITKKLSDMKGISEMKTFLENLLEK